jgi:hypothetical protein
LTTDERSIVEDLLRLAPLDEPCDWTADLLAVTRDDAGNPIGAFLGRRVDQDGRSYALLEHVFMVPGQARGKRFLAVGEAWATLCRAQGIPQALFTISDERQAKRPEMIRYARFWGFRPYKMADGRSWWVKDF